MILLKKSCVIRDTGICSRIGGGGGHWGNVLPKSFVLGVSAHLTAAGCQTIYYELHSPLSHILRYKDLP